MPPPTLLTLPAEVRNKIYTYYFHRPKFSWQPPHNRQPLTQASRQLRSETLTLFHQCLKFSIRSPKATTRFLHTYAPIHHTGITNLSLHYSTYGAPALSADVQWQEKHIAAWTTACKSLAKTLPSLRTLHLHIYLATMTPKFNLRQQWLVPLLQLRRLKGLEKVKVHLRSTLYPGWKCRLGSKWPGRSEVIVRELHDLFGGAVAKAVMGEKEKEAMKEFLERWEVERRFWGHILQFAATGW
ncbi:hypothetical protein E8E13_010533 [Curvularia kusanoi]|uniref:Uncharacterized protein n=1 Tax=Curvularia kusanoi TaxID=90978 RepID=A0A9P4TJX2_CURKU|nr:hypothetical protein E8E13_010533 [Curvularia kusanoi]